VKLRFFANCQRTRILPALPYGRFFVGSYHITRDRVVRLLVPNDLAAIITEIVRESLAAFGHRTAHPTDPPLRSAKVSPRLILLAFGVVGTHDVRKYSAGWHRLRMCGSDHFGSASLAITPTDPFRNHQFVNRC
jgi:hypothetical protein